MAQHCQFVQVGIIISCFILKVWIVDYNPTDLDVFYTDAVLLLYIEKESMLWCTYLSLYMLF